MSWTSDSEDWSSDDESSYDSWDDSRSSFESARARPRTGPPPRPRPAALPRRRASPIPRQMPRPHLSVAIDRMFRRENFPSNFRYDAHRLMLQLASHLLCTPVLQSWMYAIMFGQVLSGPPFIARGRTQTQYTFQRPEGLSHQQRETLRRGLDALSNSIRFRVADLEDDSADCQSIDGTNAESPLRGQECRIRLDERLVNTCDSARQADNEELFLWRTLFAASTILHETAHAMRRSARRDQTSGHDYAFVQGSETSEEGFELEVLLFGGTLNSCTTNDHVPRGARTIGQRVIKSAKWPDMRRIQTYADNHAEDPRSNLITLTGGRTQCPQRGVYVLSDPVRFVYKLFTDESWANRERMPDRALWPDLDLDHPLVRPEGGMHPEGEPFPREERRRRESPHRRAEPLPREEPRRQEEHHGREGLLRREAQLLQQEQRLREELRRRQEQRGREELPQREEQHRQEEPRRREEPFPREERRGREDLRRREEQLFQQEQRLREELRRRQEQRGREEVPRMEEPRRQEEPRRREGPRPRNVVYRPSRRRGGARSSSICTIM